jgi:phospholipase/carboxylesterase
LLVFLHGHGSNEDQALRLAPKLSRRNYVAISLRGPRRVEKHTGRPGYAWSTDVDTSAMVEDYVLSAVEQTRRLYHIHSERIFLAGICEGAAMAYRLGLGHPEKFAGLMLLNGQMPAPGPDRPLFKLPELRQLKVFIGHGIANAVVPFSSARRDYRALYAAGLDVRLHSYPTTHRLHAEMLRDANRWVMDRVVAEEV